MDKLKKEQDDVSKRIAEIERRRRKDLNKKQEELDKRIKKTRKK
jgi:hypothetical protein